MDLHTESNQKLSMGDPSDDLHARTQTVLDQLPAPAGSAECESSAMRLAVYDDFRLGVVHGTDVEDITWVVPEAFDRWPEQRMNWLIRNWDEAASRLDTAPASARAALETVVLRAVNPAPPQLFALPVNYRAHQGELGGRAVTTGGRTAREVGFFLKASGSVIGAGEPIELPANSLRRFDHECELGLVIGRPGRNIPRSEAREHIFGYTCLIDLTMRIEKAAGEEDRSLRKSFRSFTPLGPLLVTQDEVPNLSGLRSRLLVNHAERQAARLGDMIVAPDEAIEIISSVVDLHAGDVIATGTPSGVGPVVVGDQVTIEIEGIGEMTLPVTESAPSPRSF